MNTVDIRDRTIEFQKSVLIYKRKDKKKRSAVPTQPSQNVSKSEFQKRASLIAHEISETAQLLSKLAVLAKRKPMFNDNPVEIAELSFVIKRKIYTIEQSLLELSQVQRSEKRDAAPHRHEHSKNVVTLLNTQMKNISGDFKGVLEERQRLEMINRDRWGKIQAPNDPQQRTQQQENQQQQQQQHQRAHQVPKYNNSNPFLAQAALQQEDEQRAITSNDAHQLEEQGLSLPQGNTQTLLLMEEGALDSTNTYLQERGRAVETIESTIQEVGNLFQQLAHMVQEQGEVIQRIDANVEDIDINISGAQRELVKYFDGIKNNRWLAAKIFFVIFAFFLVWVLVN